MPAPKTLVPATRVKNEKTRRGSIRSAHKARGNRTSRKDREQHQTGIGHKVDHKECVRPSAPTLDEEGVRDDAGCHDQAEAAGIERRNLAVEPSADMPPKDGGVEFALGLANDMASDGTADIDRKAHYFRTSSGTGTSNPFRVTDTAQ